jgi:hypothetical protein
MVSDTSEDMEHDFNPINNWERGDKVYHFTGGKAKIMCVADNYIMARRKGCAPFVVSYREATLAFLKYSQTNEGEDDGT